MNTKGEVGGASVQGGAEIVVLSYYRAQVEMRGQPDKTADGLPAVSRHDRHPPYHKRTNDRR